MTETTPTIFASVPTKDLRNLANSLIKSLSDTVDEGHHIALVNVIQQAYQELANRGEHR